MGQYKIARQVGGLFGPSEAEKTEAAATLQVICSSYLNALALQQSMNKAMRDLTVSATASGTLDSSEYKAAIAALRVTAEDASSVAHNSLARLQAIGKNDSGVWDYMNTIGQKLSSGALVNEVVTTKSGTKIQVQMSSRTPQVGVIPIALIIVAVIVLSISAAAVAIVITQSNREYSSSVGSLVNTLRKSAEQKLLLADKVAQAGEDLAAGRITQAQHDAQVAGYKNAIITIENTENALPKVKDLPKPENPLDLTKSLKYAVPIVLVIGGTIVAWKTGLFDVAKKQVTKRWA